MITPSIKACYAVQSLMWLFNFDSWLLFVTKSLFNSNSRSTFILSGIVQCGFSVAGFQVKKRKRSQRHDTWTKNTTTTKEAGNNNRRRGEIVLNGALIFCQIASTLVAKKGREKPPVCMNYPVWERQALCEEGGYYQKAPPYPYQVCSIFHFQAQWTLKFKKHYSPKCNVIISISFKSPS